MNAYKMWFQIDENVIPGFPEIERYELVFPARVNLYRGNSGVGKTFFISKLKGFLQLALEVDIERRMPLLAGVNNGKICVITADNVSDCTSIVQSISGKGYVVCIDNWDLLVQENPKLPSLIEEDISNIYILFGRSIYTLSIPTDAVIECKLKKSISQTSTSAGERVKVTQYILGGTE